MKLFKKVFLPLCLTAAMTAGITACDFMMETPAGSSNSEPSTESSTTSQTPVTYTLNLTADKTTALRGDVVTLSAYLISADAESQLVEDATFQITEGADYATLAGNALTIAPTAANNTVIKVKAKVGETDSNIVEIKVIVPLAEIVVSANGITNVPSNSFVSLSKTTSPEGADLTGIKWEITEGSEYAVLNGDLLLISATAPQGATIKVWSVCGDVESIELTFTVGIPATSVSATLVGLSNVNPGDSRLINVTALPTNASTAGIAWSFSEGEEYASIENNVLTVDAEAPIGAKISFKALLDGQESDVIEIVVGTPIESITLQASAEQITKGTSAILSATILPTTANEAYEWIFTEGAEYAKFFENSIIVNADAPTDAVIKVKAVSKNGKVESENELTFTVLATQEEINASKYFFSLSTDQITLDKYATTSPVLSVELYNYNYEQITDKAFTFTVDEKGQDFLAVTANGSVCTFTALGHGYATVTVSAEGVAITEDVEVEILVPPTALNLPEVFRVDGRNNYQYNYSMYDHGSKAEHTGKDPLPFEATVVEDSNNPLPCLDVVYTFTHEDGTTGDEVATYDVENGAIIFNKLGLVTVTATSNSGSRMDVSTSYTFNINDGFNIYTFDEAATFINSLAYKGEVVNFVVLEKPVATYEGAPEYGYEFVPALALKPQSEQEFLDIINPLYSRIIAVNTSLHINGNKHTINASNLKLLTETEIDKGNQTYGRSYAMHGGLLSVEPWTESGADVTGEFYVNLYDLTAIGNVPLNYENKTNPGAFFGGYTSAISIGNLPYSAKYTVDIHNVAASGAKDGIKMVSVVKGTLKNAYAYDCYQNGFAFRSSIMAVENLKLGACGAVGIELMPEASDKAGRNDNESQTITFQGQLDVTGNIHSLDTTYLNNYVINLGAPMNVPYLVDTSISVNGLTDNQLTHLFRTVDGKKEYCMITFILADTGTGMPNASQAQYPSYQDGGIIEATDLPKSGVDTTHQFVRMTVYAMPGMPLGSVLLYNLNYQAK